MSDRTMRDRVAFTLANVIIRLIASPSARRRLAKAVQIGYQDTGLNGYGEKV